MRERLGVVGEPLQTGHLVLCGLVYMAVLRIGRLYLGRHVVVWVVAFLGGSWTRVSELTGALVV